MKDAKKQDEITIEWKGLDRADIDDLYSFLKSREGVAHVYTRMSTMDAAYDPSIHPTLSMIVGFSVVVVVTVGPEALRALTHDWIKEWRRNRRTANPAPEITTIYGPDQRAVKRVKKTRPPKAK